MDDAGASMHALIGLGWGVAADGGGGCRDNASAKTFDLPFSQDIEKLKSRIRSRMRTRRGLAILERGLENTPSMRPVVCDDGEVWDALEEERTL